MLSHGQILLLRAHSPPTDLNINCVALRKGHCIILNPFRNIYFVVNALHKTYFNNPNKQCYVALMPLLYLAA